VVVRVLFEHVGARSKQSLGVGVLARVKRAGIVLFLRPCDDVTNDTSIRDDGR